MPSAVPRFKNNSGARNHRRKKNPPPPKPDLTRPHRDVMMHCAVLFRRHGNGHIEKVAVGFNNWKAHAETEVMRAWIRQKDDRRSMDGLELIVWRIRHCGSYAPSKPCWNCVQALGRFSRHRRLMCPRIIWYTHEEEEEENAPVFLVRSNIGLLLCDPHPHVRRSTIAIK